jgi:Protein ENHANCED DISEASE RESISTANCE 2, C-terminal
MARPRIAMENEPSQSRAIPTTSFVTVPAVVPSSGSSEAGSDEGYVMIGNGVEIDAERGTSPIFEMLVGNVPPMGTICGARSQSTTLIADANTPHELLAGRVTRLSITSNNSESAPKLPSPMGSLFRSSTVPNNQMYSEMTNHPPSLRLDAWSEIFAHNFMVRGSNYLNDNKKVCSESSLFQLLTVDLVCSDAPNFQGLCSHPHERIQQALQKEKATGIKQLPSFVFAVNLCVPAAASTTPTGTTPVKSPSKVKSTNCYHLVAYFGIEDISIITTNHQRTAIGRLCHQFFFGESDKFRDTTFKLIPRIAEGNFVVRKAVGSKPSILGKKLRQYYIRTDRFMELIVDIGSDSVATRIVKLALGYAKSLTVDMMFVLEGATDETLPERILGGVRVKEIDFKNKDGQRACVKM